MVTLPRKCCKAGFLLKQAFNSIQLPWTMEKEVKALCKESAYLLNDKLAFALVANFEEGLAGHVLNTRMQFVHEFK